MKKLWFMFSLTLAVTGMAANLHANIDNLSNMSVEWMRTGARNAATDSTDIVNYNPAGLTAFSDGIYLNIGNQTMIREPEHSFDMGAGRKSYKQDDPDWILPNFYAAYKKDRWSLFGGVYIPGGGAVADYPDGSVTTQFIGSLMTLFSGGAYTGFQNDYLEASSLYLATAIGGACKINEKVSLALGIRYIDAENEVEAGAAFMDASGTGREYRLDYEESAGGFGCILGLDWFPDEKLNIGMRYESKVSLEFETDLNRNDFPAFFGLAEDDKKRDRDFPAVFGIGAAYDIRPELTAELDFSWYFQKQADWGETASGEDISDLAGDAWSMGAAVSYQLNSKWLLSGGIIFTKFMFDDMDGYYEEIGSFEVLYSDNWNIGAGAAYRLMENTNLNLALGWTIWKDETISYNNARYAGMEPFEVETQNNTITFSFGVDVKY